MTKKFAQTSCSLWSFKSPEKFGGMLAAQTKDTVQDSRLIHCSMNQSSSSLFLNVGSPMLIQLIYVLRVSFFGAPVHTKALHHPLNKINYLNSKIISSIQEELHFNCFQKVPQAMIELVHGSRHNICTNLHSLLTRAIEPSYAI